MPEAKAIALRVRTIRKELQREDDEQNALQMLEMLCTGKCFFGDRDQNGCCEKNNEENSSGSTPFRQFLCGRHRHYRIVAYEERTTTINEWQWL